MNFCFGLKYQDLVDQLHQKCMQEGAMARGSAPYSSLSQDPSAWLEEPKKPCSGERLLLAYDRWRKLSRSFYNRKRDTFHISKVPDIYDSVKYDAIHNPNLGLKTEVNGTCEHSNGPWIPCSCHIQWVFRLDGWYPLTMNLLTLPLWTQHFWLIILVQQLAHGQHLMVAWYPVENRRQLIHSSGQLSTEAARAHECEWLVEIVE